MSNCNRRNIRKRRQRRRRAETRKWKWAMALLREQVNAVAVAVLFNLTPYELAEQEFLECVCSGTGELCAGCEQFAAEYEPEYIAAYSARASIGLTYQEAVRMGDA